MKEHPRTAPTRCQDGSADTLPNQCGLVGVLNANLTVLCCSSGCHLLHFGHNTVILYGIRLIEKQFYPPRRGQMAREAAARVAAAATTLAAMHRSVLLRRQAAMARQDGSTAVFPDVVPAAWQGYPMASS